MKKLFAVVLLCWSLVAFAGADEALRAKITRMLIVGFDAAALHDDSPIARTLRRLPLGGVILFDRDYRDRNRSKNIVSPKQLETLTAQLRGAARAPLLIAVDQEGGKVQRLKPSAGFAGFPSAMQVGKRRDDVYARAVYDALAAELAGAGINLDFAPVVDLARNPDNFVIFKLQRSYGADPAEVARMAGIFAEALRAHGVVPVLKHFPGHGSSLGDSHKGFVDVTDTWKPDELEPYRLLIAAGDADMIMTAHVFNRRLDARYPATLSRKVNTQLLRNRLGFSGVIVSDDLQMKAISEHYSLRETVRLAIDAGVDMLLFGNQLGKTTPDEVIDAVEAEVEAGRIPRSRIDASAARIEALTAKYGIGAPTIVEKPIRFGKKRVALTKAYIAKHYGKTVHDIRIDPKIIVLHWTADTDMNRSFAMLDPEVLPGARGDIAAAGALNVSAHYLVDRDGTIYRLMPDNVMARHVIGLNDGSIGIENVGGEGNAKDDLTDAQLYANIALVRYLKRKYPGIRYLIGHHEYRRMEHTPLWHEKDKGYRTVKKDPGDRFMRAVRRGVRDLGLEAPPR